MKWTVKPSNWILSIQFVCAMLPVLGYINAGTADHAHHAMSRARPRVSTVVKRFFQLARPRTGFLWIIYMLTWACSFHTNIINKYNNTHTSIDKYYNHNCSYKFIYSKRIFLLDTYWVVSWNMCSIGFRSSHINRTQTGTKPLDLHTICMVIK